MTNNRICADQFEAVCFGITKRSGMYVDTDNYHAVTAFIDGMDTICNGMMGFHQWLEMRVGTRYNVGWQVIILELSPTPIPWPPENSDQNKRAIGLIGETLKEFFEYREKVGVTHIYTEYSKWIENTT